MQLHRARLARSDPPQLDAAQLRAVQHCVDQGRVDQTGAGPLHLLGGPGSGKSTVVVEAVAAKVRSGGLDPGQVLVLAPTRLAAARLRELVTARLARTVQEPLARTPQSFAFGVLRLAAARDGAPAPRLITGPEQDLVLRELLAGHRSGDGTDPGWPDGLRPALTTRGFRGELRDLLMRAVERGVGPADLADLGRAQGRPEWVAASIVLCEYLDVTGLGAPGGCDPAAIIGEAVAALAADPDLLALVRGQLRFIAVDDAHEATPAVADLVRAIAGGRPHVLLTGDPDATTQTFRGADPGLLLGAGPPGAGPGSVTPGAATPDPVTLVLGTSWRQGLVLGAATVAVARRIGAVGGGRQRALTPAPGLTDGEVRVVVARSVAHETALIADALRRRHLRGGLPWRDMAVIVRGRARSAELRRGLALAGVPVDVPSTEVPVRDQPAVVPLLDAFEAALALAAGAEHPLPPERAQALLLSPLGGTDSMGIRRLRRALRAQEADDDGGPAGRVGGDPLVQALLDPARLAMLDRAVAAPARRVAEVLAAGAAVAGGLPAAGTATGNGPITAETVLWALWSASRLAGPWRRSALAGGPAGARVDQDLDAVVALFDAAARFVDRLPRAGPREFVAYLRGQEVAGDTLAERAATPDAVTVLTPASAAGRQWPVVVVAGVQDGVWPDLRLRGSLLGSEHLVDVLTGRDGSARAALAAVRDDETRLFHVAVGRASLALLVTAVRDEDDQPSVFLDVVDPQPPDDADAGDGVRPSTDPPVPLTLPGAVARLRQLVTDPAAGPDVAGRAAGQLARLAAAGVPGADPDDWLGLAPLTDDRPLRAGGPVRVSPSRVEEFDRCALRWLLQQAGGVAADSASQSLGTLVHALAAELPEAPVELLLLELRRRWDVLGLGPGWVGDVGRARAEQVVAKLAEYLRQSGRELVGTELDVDVELDLPDGPVRVTGRVDRLERDAEGLHVVDLKTGRSAPTKAELPEQPQLGTYQLAARAGAFAARAPGVDPAGAELVQLGTSAKKPGVQRQAALPPDGGWARELVTEVARGMAGQEFPATLNDLCGHCPVRTSCPARAEGRRVTT
jgi:superfamily I DNA/RNA helicase/RecB family exonuclease